MARRDKLIRRKRSRHPILEAKKSANIYDPTKTIKRKGPKMVRMKSPAPKPIIYEYPPLPPNSKFAIVVKSHARDLAHDLGYDTCHYKINHMEQYDGIIFIGPYYSKMLHTLYAFHVKYPQKRIIIWWVGSDVMKALGPLYDSNLPNRIAYKHLCVSNDLQRELKSIGISAEVVTLIPDVKRYRKRALPGGRYTVGVYIPHNNPRVASLYQWANCKAIMEKTPYINYIVYGNKNPIPDAPKNCKVMGWVDDTSIVLKKCHCLLRLTDHDGFPKSIIEAILMGRAVITNHDYPHVIQSGNINTIVNIIKEKPTISDDVIAYYRTTYTRDKLRETIERIWGK